MIPDIHRQSVVVDGLIVSNFTRTVLEDMRDGGISAANCTCCVWEDTAETLRNVATWKHRIAENADLLMQVHHVDDILKAKQAGKVGIILGWQNTTGYGDNLDLVPVFAELGVRVAQMTYNTANFAGSGCYEKEDRGVTGFGRDLIAALNQAGVLIDLSHTGPRTAADTIAFSKKPVAYTHCAPGALQSHPRNKSDEQLRAIADAGGFVGVTMFPAFLRRGAESTVEDYIEAIEHVINLIGEEAVGIGTDMTQEQPPAFFDWINRDKGNGRKLVDFGKALQLGGFTRLRDFPNLTAEMERRGWPPKRIENVLGANWLRLLREVWHG